MRPRRPTGEFLTSFVFSSVAIRNVSHWCFNLCIYRQRMKLETEKTEKETQLEHNLFRKREELEAELAEVSEQDLAERLREAQEELKEVS